MSYIEVNDLCKEYRVAKTGKGIGGAHQIPVSPGVHGKRGRTPRELFRGERRDRG